MASVFFLAGELSGDLIASHLACALREKCSDIALSGVGSRRLLAAGADIIADSSTWGAIGVLEGFRSALKVRPQVPRLIQRLRENPPDVFVPVDFPFLNLRMVRLAKAIGSRVAYLAAPVTWQWFGSRPLMKAPSGVPLSKIARLRGFVDVAFPLYPFAVRYYQEAGVPCEYYGHPEIAALRASSRRWSEDAVTSELAVFPGSRTGEIRTHLGIILRAVYEWTREQPSPVIRVSVAHSALRRTLRESLATYPLQPVANDVFLWENARVILEETDSVELMLRSRLSVMVSGTILHQAMAVGAPSIAIYRVPALLAEVTRAFLLNLPYYTLPNLLMAREVCPELIQESLTSSRLAETLHFLWHNPDRRAQVSRDLMSAGDRLHIPGGTGRMADSILERL
jgi:lipid-A-disaccharide synthase